MVEEKNCVYILCLPDSLISAGLKKVVIEMIIKNNMIDTIVSTGANIGDQCFVVYLNLFRFNQVNKYL